MTDDEPTELPVELDWTEVALYGLDVAMRRAVMRAILVVEERWPAKADAIRIPAKVTPTGPHSVDIEFAQPIEVRNGESITLELIHDVDAGGNIGLPTEAYELVPVLSPPEVLEGMGAEVDRETKTWTFTLRDLIEGPQRPDE